MASKKGIAITAAIAAAIIGSSFLVWMIPQSTTGNFNSPRTDGEVISDVYSRHLDLASSVESDYSSWKNGTMSSEDMQDRLISASADIRLMTQSLQRQTAAEWQESYDLYKQALDVFGEYLGEIEMAVESGETSALQEIESLEAEWQRSVDQSVQAMPIAR